MKAQRQPGVIIIRPCISTYVVLDGICAIFLGLSLILCILGATNAGVLAVVLCAALLAIHSWIASHAVILSDLVLEYRFIWHTKAIALSQIETFEFRVGWDRYRDRSQPYYRIVIRPRNQNDTDVIVINAKLFGLRDVRAILDALAVARSTR